MALQFAIADLNFSNVRGTQKETRTVSFNNVVQRAETALHGFTAGPPRASARAGIDGPGRASR